MEMHQLIASYEETLDRADKIFKHNREKKGLDPNITFDEFLDDDPEVDDMMCSKESLDGELIGTYRAMMEHLVRHPDDVIAAIQKSLFRHEILEGLKDLAEEDEAVCSDEVHAKIAEALD